MEAERYPTESALLSGAAGGDPEAVRALIDSVGPVVYGFVFARVGGDEPTAQPAAEPDRPPDSLARGYAVGTAGPEVRWRSHASSADPGSGRLT